MLHFYEPTVEDIKWVQPLIEKSGAIGCDVSFGNTFLWRKRYNIQIAKFNNFMIKAYFLANEITGYCFPIGSGSDDDYKKAFETIFEDSAQRGNSVVFGMLTNSNVETMQRLFPNVFDYSPNRDDFDYIYNQQDLALLAGRKYHGKRGHISKFFKENENIKFMPITNENKDDAIKVAKCWCCENGCTGGDGLSAEYCAIKEAFSNFEELNLFGGILYLNEKPVAMTVGSKINDEVCDIHFEKALSTVNEGYAVVNNEFAKSLTNFKYINREEDMGIEGLRKAKLSYKPAILLEKFTAKLVD